MRAWWKGLASPVQLCLILFGFSFLFIRIYNSNAVFLIQNSGDDAGFYAWTEVLLRAHTANWCEANVWSETLTQDCRVNRYNNWGPGPALLLLPFTGVGALLERVGIWAPTAMPALRFWSVVGTFFLFLGGSLALLAFTRRVLKNDRLAFWSTVAFLCGNPVLYYVFRRPLMAHAAEFFLFFCCASLALRTWKDPKLHWSWVLLLGAVVGFFVPTRMNDYYLVPLFCALLAPRLKARQRVAGLVGIAVSGLIFLMAHRAQSGSWFFDPSTVDPGSSNMRQLLLPQMQNLSRLIAFVVSPHWGAVWLMPLFGIELVLLGYWAPQIWKWLKSSWFWSGLTVLSLLSSLVMQSNYPSNGMAYGNRYLLTQLDLLHLATVLGFAAWRIPEPLKRFTVARKGGFSVVSVLVLVFSFVAAFQVINFESAPHLSLRVAPFLDEGIRRADPRELGLVAPYYGVRSVMHTASGRGVFNLGAAPLLGYPLMALAGSGVEHLPGVRSAYEYYSSEKRNIHGLIDLRVLFDYHAWIALILFVGIIGTSRLSVRRGGRRGH